MPIYEFYCHQCNTVYNFFSKTANTTKIPTCPQCKRIKLKRQMSVFANPSKGKEGQESDELRVDPSVLEKTMATLANEAEKMKEDDPRAAARLMRQLSKAGINFGPGMEEAISRLEKGEDPEQIEAEMADVLENEEPFILQASAKPKGKKIRPRVDDTLYDL
ncbi:MAG: zinc ribbon domain-containing protein [Deltaproteobacteria bacterium]|nr:zinc ribbon domain-containing protein [Deltaproteobacteria bacterium]